MPTVLHDLMNASGALSERKRFVVTYRETPKEGKPKVFHNFFSAIDPGGAEAEFWRTPIWKPPVKKIEIVSIEEV